MHKNTEVPSANSTTPPSPPQTDFLAAAASWYDFGFQVVPIGPGSKISAVKWDDWLDGQSQEKIHRYWTSHPDHELGFIVGNDVVVFDADTVECVTALFSLENRFKLEPALVVLTSKGQHHYFKRSSGALVKSDSHSTEQHPDRIDIKTGRALVVLPPSTGKSIVTCTAKSKAELTEVSQDFIDAVYVHNGRTAPSQQPVPSPRPIDRTIINTGEHLPKLQRLLDCINPDIGYEDWLKVGMALFHETGGSEEGLQLFDKWSSGGKKYRNSHDSEAKWRSFRDDMENPITIGTLIKLAKDAGADVASILDDEAFVAYPEEQFVDGSESVSTQTSSAPSLITPLNRYFINDVGELEKQAQEQRAILGPVVLSGQVTVLYAKPNTGKTLIMLSLIMESIKKNRINPNNLIYINMDDNSNGLVEKARIAQEYGFNMIADGYNNFEAKKFWKAMLSMIESNTACGQVIILDTLKKFANIMDKKESSEFARIARQFVMKGGTIVALAHVNKRPGNDGKPIYAGTTDILDDFDCGYTINTIDENTQNKTKIVEFEKIKGRGNVPLSTSRSLKIGSI